ncbi:MAG TPA: bifunctional diaminohydroxyphosphoribosylaminopyrimidine deaminase/5-amino-6-(5-phosphoribosylamino)uracil reductase RibD [Chromatiales bacterium]|nr:bifunctional diaminohydroxyphosphoribosylaminopyrimidine deaminase/5-amino-6-(5-phosphoribosylamino)uracil reductase RibD [Chromatiales bacterium]
MARALRLARRGLYTTQPNPRVGCVLVRDGRVVGEGWHQRAGGPHAEVLALRAAGGQAREATAYVTLEPCCHHGRTPPCTEALIEAGVAEVVVAMEDPNPRVSGQGLARLREAGIRVRAGLLAREAEALNPGFVSRMRRGRPWVRLKSAMSLDGRTAMASGESQWITGAAARADVQRQRARVDAVLTGIGTVRADDPGLNVRLSAEALGIQGPVRQPLRVVLDPDLESPADMRMLRLPGRTLILTAAPEAPGRRALEAAGAELLPVPPAPGGLDLERVLAALAALEVNEVLVEAGATLAGGFLTAGLVDEWLIYMAPHVMGHAARGLAVLPQVERMHQRLPMRLESLRAIGEDLRFVWVPERR